MKFGLWVEPERVSLATVGKSGLAQEPLLATHGNDYGSALNAQICLAGAAGRKWVMDQLVALIDRVRPDYLKWDNNFWINCDRGGHGHGAADGNMAHVQALYGILDELRRRYPDLMIENVSGGGARLDFGMMAFTDTAWMDDRTAPASHVRHNLEGLTFAFPPAYLLSFLIDGDGEPIAGADDLALLVRSRAPGILGLTYRTELDRRRHRGAAEAADRGIQDLSRHHHPGHRDLLSAQAPVDSDELGSAPGSQSTTRGARCCSASRETARTAGWWSGRGDCWPMRPTTCDRSTPARSARHAATRSWSTASS